MANFALSARYTKFNLCVIFMSSCSLQTSSRITASSIYPVFTLNTTPCAITERNNLDISMHSSKSLINFEKNVAPKMKFSIKNLLNKGGQIRSLLRIWSHLLKKFLMKNFIYFLCSISCNPQDALYKAHITVLTTKELKILPNQI